ncbi:hypothetical protein [Kaistia sp. UC242_56]|uniref:hypothetical protein n=1 Tax=Kaistia sp. UC242_56 TaxID=3374625 RepID=UPI00378AB931
MTHRIVKLETMAKALAGFAEEATAMNEHQLASLLIEAMAEAERRARGIAASLPESGAP